MDDFAALGLGFVVALALALVVLGLVADADAAGIFFVADFFLLLLLSVFLVLVPVMLRPQAPSSPSSRSNPFGSPKMARGSAMIGDSSPPRRRAKARLSAVVVLSSS